jgi:hypothetical protein
LLLSPNSKGHSLAVEFQPSPESTAEELTAELERALGVLLPEPRGTLVDGEMRYSFEVSRLLGLPEDTERAVVSVLEGCEHSLTVRPLRLEPGDLLVTSALEVVVDGMPVRVASASGGPEERDASQPAAASDGAGLNAADGDGLPAANDAQEEL